MVLKPIVLWVGVPRAALGLALIGKDQASNSKYHGFQVQYLQLTEFASRLEDQEEDQEYDFERNQIDLKLGIRLLSREIVGSKSTDIALNPLFTDFKARLEQSACYFWWKC